MTPSERLIAGTGSISSPPVIYDRLIRVINDQRARAADAGRVISEDPGLTARLLRTVNSAMFAFPQPIESVSQAVTVVGTRQIRDLALATSVTRMFEDVPAYLIDMHSFWQHSLACGVIARRIASQWREPNIERFFVAGLLHDIGRLVLFLRAGAQVKQAMDRAYETGQPLYRCETEVLECHHGQVGDALLAKWRFDGAYREAVAYHHSPTLARRHPIETAAVHVADIIAHGFGWGRSGEPRVPPFEPRAWAVLDLDPSIMRVILKDAERQMEAAMHVIGGMHD
jgi:putative nucleotidyltransferase with HDIG domain